MIETPLMWIDKAQTWAMAQRLGGEALVELIVEDTHSCYLGDRRHAHAWGYGCGACPACELRAKGYEKYQGATRPQVGYPRVCIVCTMATHEERRTSSSSLSAGWTQWPCAAATNSSCALIYAAGPVPRTKKDLPIGTVKAILKQAGLK